ncbi:MAG: hypothetical protein CW338_11490 [Clostridiales bacterium]|nr:hypothetical protein [Clostridiales bacterium]
MTKQDGIQLFESIYPGFFERESIRGIPEEWICDEMILPLENFDPRMYSKDLDAGVTFGYCDCGREALLDAVGQVVQSWIPLYDGRFRTYCGYADGKLASFCMVEDMGVHRAGGKLLKVGGPGCVGTVPAYRRRGIGLTMIRNVTQILKDEGYDLSYIHYTGVAPWYAKLGYESIVKWNRNGIL